MKESKIIFAVGEMPVVIRLQFVRDEVISA